MPKKIKIVAISDLHGNLPSLPFCDLLLIAGDVCPTSDHSIIFQSSWLNSNFYSWLKTQKYHCCIWIAGNHCFALERSPNLVRFDKFKNINVYFLQDQSYNYNGIKVWGSAWTNWFWDWAFNLHQVQIREKWNLIPKDTNILLLHSPAEGYGDLNNQNIRIGSKSLTEKILEIQPKLYVFGHNHEQGFQRFKIGNTDAYNVSLLDEKYKLVNPPTEIEYVL